MSTEPDQQCYYLNGIDATTGSYIDDGFWTAEEIVALAVGDTMPNAVFNDHQKRVAHAATQAGDPDKRTWAVPPGYNAENLDSVGWCVLAPQDGDPEILQRLQPLLKKRCTDTRSTWGVREPGQLYREFKGADGYRQGETWDQFRARLHIQLGLARPNEMPYYVLLVGSPEEIPFSFQYEMDVQRAVGRIHFEALDDYSQYACSVVDAEAGKVRLPQRVVLFGTHNPYDQATALSAEYLVKPLLASHLGQDPGSNATWQIEPVWPDEALKPRMRQLLGGADTPALFFSATHGAGFSPNDAHRQRTHQGALVCQEWPGPLNWKGQLTDDCLFSANDIDDEAQVGGVVAVFFACFSAGTPRASDFLHRRQSDAREPRVVADKAFVSPLARRLLAHPRGGALAVVGHIERAWPSTFIDLLADRQAAVGAFETLLASLLKGYRLGNAMEAFNLRYAEISTRLVTYLFEVTFRHQQPDATMVAGLWTANNDARNFVVIGDPAVRLAPFLG